MTGRAQRAQLAEAAIMRAADGQRFIIALSGPPGAGKSTLSEMLVAEFSRRGQTAAIVPMDGFHLDNAVLEARGTLARKGAPFTFDADGYAELLERLRRTPAQRWPFRSSTACWTWRGPAAASSPRSTAS
jgi:pantothenate kinase